MFKTDLSGFFDCLRYYIFRVKSKYERMHSLKGLQSLFVFRKVRRIVMNHAPHDLIHYFTIFGILYVSFGVIYLLLKTHGEGFHFALIHVFLTLFVLLISHNLQMLLFVELHLFSYRQNEHQ